MHKYELCQDLSFGEKPISYPTLRKWMKLAGLYDEIPDLKNRRVFSPAEINKIKQKLAA
jgi:hypothetical protein